MRCSHGQGNTCVVIFGSLQIIFARAQSGVIGEQSVMGAIYYHIPITVTISHYSAFSKSKSYYSSSHAFAVLYNYRHCNRPPSTVAICSLYYPLLTQHHRRRVGLRPRFRAQFFPGQCAWNAVCAWGERGIVFRCESCAACNLFRVYAHFHSYPWAFPKHTTTMKFGYTESGEDKRRTGGVNMTHTTLLLTVLVLLCVFLILSVVGPWSDVGIATGKALATAYSSTSSMTHDSELLCEGGAKQAVIYNKSPKTASSFILNVMINWTKSEKRPLYRCYLGPLQTSASIKSCVPKRPDPCGVFTEHVFLDPSVTQLFAQRFPNHLLLTSTRYPGHRIVSFFLFIRDFRDDDPTVLESLSGYLRRYNPWGLYNYHTGESRDGSCPLTKDEKKLVYAAVSRFDIVIDLNSVRASNAILKHHNLFTLPERTELKDRHKERGAVRVNMTDELLQLLGTKVCVENELHLAFQFKMADLYERATGEKCMFDPEFPTPDTCVTREERETLKDYWHVDQLPDDSWGMFVGMDVVRRQNMGAWEACGGTVWAVFSLIRDRAMMIYCKRTRSQALGWQH